MGDCILIERSDGEVEAGQRNVEWRSAVYRWSVDRLLVTVQRGLCELLYRTLEISSSRGNKCFRSRSVFLERDCEQRAENLAARIAAKPSHELGSWCMLLEQSFDVTAAKEIVCERRLHNGWHLRELNVAISRSIHEVIVSNPQVLGLLRPIGL